MSNYFVSLILSLSSTDSEELLIFPKSNNKITIKIDLCFTVIVLLSLSLCRQPSTETRGVRILSRD
jgi:hypothetical protein